MRAIVYIRRSKEEPEERLSLDVQRREAIEFVKKQNWSLVGILVDERQKANTLAGKRRRSDKNALAKSLLPRDWNVPKAHSHRSPRGRR